MSNLKFPIPNLIKLVVFVAILLTASYLLLTTAYATHCPLSDYDCQIAEIQREIDAISGAHEKNKQELTSLNSQLASLKKRIAGLSVELTKVEKEITAREEDLAFTKEVFDAKAQNHYKFIRMYDPLLPFLAAETATEAIREFNFRTRASDEDRKIMEKYAQEIASLKDDRATLEKNKKNLAAAQVSVNDRAKFLQGEVDKVETYIASMSAKQQELAALKAGGFQTSVGDTPPTLVPCSGKPGSSNFCDPGFRPAFSAFSFGAPHRTGMSQYGAYGRSKSSQNAETILSAYFQGADLNRSYPVPATITVSGIGTIPFEDNYLLGIYEVPESWGDSGGFEALKAQAVAARSYAIAKINGGGCPKGNPGAISPTEACQVYKPQLKSGKWAEAVRATRGWVLTKGGTAANTYFASTSGGYTISQWGWNGIKDTSGDWPSTAYEQAGGSPWFYMGWYKSRGGQSCGRSNPWLKNEEFADILNAWVVLTKGAGDVSRISPVGDCWGGNPYSMGDLASIGGYTSVSDVSVTYGNDGSTLSVGFNTNKGNVNIPGAEFKQAFNLRAPGYIGLKSSLFNIEKL